MTLSQRVKKLLGLDEAQAKAANPVKNHPKSRMHIECDWRAFYGAKRERARTADLEAALCEVVGAVGESYHGAQMADNCAICQALEKLANACEGMETR